MKFFFSFILLSVSIIPAQAQSYPGDVEPDRNSGDIPDASSFISLDYKISHINDLQADQTGLTVGAILRRKLSIGISYFSLLGQRNRVSVDGINNSPLSMSYGGLNIDYSVFPLEWIKVGAGGVLSLGRLSTGNSNYPGITTYSTSDWFGQFEPKAFVGVNVISTLWINLTYWYMLPFGVDYYNVNSKSLQGPAFAIGLSIF